MRYVLIILLIMSIFNVYTTVLKNIEIEKLTYELSQKDVSLKAYRISTGRNIALLDDNELKIITKVCGYVPQSIPLLYAWRRHENGYPGHEMGIKRRMVNYNEYEQYYNAKIILYQEMSKFCMLHKDEFVPFLAKRINFNDRVNWSNDVLKILEAGK